MHLRVFALLLALTLPPAVLAQEDCLPSRAVVGSLAHVADGEPNRLRDAPSSAGNPIGSIPPARPFTVLDIGPCAGGVQWMRVSYQGQDGWTAESLDDVYFVEVLSSPPDLPDFVTAQVVGQVEGTPNGRLSYSQDGSFATPAGVFRAGGTQPVFSLPQLNDDGSAQDYLIHPTNPNLVFVYVMDERMQLWDIGSNQMLYQATYTGNGFSYQQRADFSGDGSTLFYSAPDQDRALDLATLQVRDSEYLTVGRSPTRMVWGRTSAQALPERFEQTDLQIYDLTTGDIRQVRRGTLVMADSDAITPDDTRYVLRDFEGTIEVWDTGTWEQRSRSESPYETSARSVRLAVSNQYAAVLEELADSGSGLLRLFDLTTGQTVATLTFDRDIPSFSVGLTFTTSGEQLGLLLEDTLYTIDVARWAEAGDVPFEAS